MSIQYKAILAVMAIITGLTAVFLYLGHDSGRQVRARYLRILSSQLEQAIEYNTDVFKKRYSTRIRGFIYTHSDILEAFKNRDRERLYRATLPKFNVLRTENRYMYGLTYLLPDATVLLRMQQPDFFGDSVDDIPVCRHFFKTESLTTGFAVSKIGLYYRVVAPVRHQGRFIGAVGWAFKASMLVDRLGPPGEVIYGIFVNSDKYKKIVMPNSDLVAVDGHVLVADSENSVLFQNLPLDFVIHQPDQSITTAGRTYLIRSSKLVNFSGLDIGSLVLAQDITAETSIFRRQTAHTIGLALSAMAVSFVILYFSFGMLIGRIEKLNETLEAKVAERTAELQESLDKVQLLGGMLPICSVCKKIRDDQGYWNQIESYIRDHSEAEFSHSICPDCAKKLYPDFYEDEK